MTMQDDLGDRMKGYERAETGRRFLPLLPVYARIDGRCFSSFTKGMDRPYDDRMIDCMVRTTIALVEETGAIVGYTQSDEISLLWYSEDYKSQIFFDGKIFKMVSVTAALATGIFREVAKGYWPDKIGPQSPVFDCRVFQLPTKEEATNAILWRELDATKNAISMAARAKFSHKRLNGVNGDQTQEMLFREHGINFNDYPARFKRGTFVQRKTVCRELEPERLARIPEEHRPNGPIERQVVEPIDMPPLRKVENRVGVLFDGEIPRCAPRT